MRPPYCVLRNRLIVFSICLCALLAFGTTLSADTYTFYPGHGLSGVTYLGQPVGPYGGTLHDNNTNLDSPNALFFCLTGNQSYGNTESVNLYTPYTAPNPPSTIAYEEAAYLASLLLTDATKDGVTLGTTGTGNNKTVVFTGTPTQTQINTFETDSNPLQMAIWFFMGTLPSAQASVWTNVANINNGPTKTLVQQAIDNYAKYTYYNVQVVTLVSHNCAANGSGAGSGTSPCGGQDFISVSTLPSVPEPGTMVLFGTGALLMGLGCARRRLLRRPR